MSILRTPTSEPSEPTSKLPEAAQSDVPSSSDAKLTPNLWEQQNSKPFLTKVYEGETAWDTLSSDEQINAELITDHFKDLSKKGEYRTDEVAYRDFLKKYEKITETQSAPFNVKIQKIGEFIRYIKRTT